MKSYIALPMLTCFLAGIVLDMTLSRVAIDAVFIAALVATVLVLIFAARPRKKGIPRRSRGLKVVKSRKAANNR